jgi:hypothetical protein
MRERVALVWSGVRVRDEMHRRRFGIRGRKHVQLEQGNQGQQGIDVDPGRR